jgi:Protein of unknown function (DUF3147)
VDGHQLLRDDEQPVGFEGSRIFKVTPLEIGIRFVFGAGIALVAAVVGTVFGAKVGGLFLAFPAVLPATLTLIEKKEGTTKAWADASGGVLGAVGLAAFAFTTAMLLRWNPVAALLLALGAWAVVAGGLFLLFRETGLFLKQDRLLSKPR